MTSYPLELLGLLAPAAQRAPVSLLPSIAVSEEYNDNLFLDNRNRQSDFITGLSPALMLFVNRPALRLTAGYTFTSELYQEETRFNDVFSRQNFILNGTYEGYRGFTLTLTDSYALDRSTNLVATQGFASGRQEAWSNVFTPGVGWQITPATALNVFATHAVQRFKGTGTGIGSDTYGLQTTLGHVLTPRFTGTVGYGFTYLDLQEQQDSTTHTPTLGVNYRLTPTLTGSLSGGPAITELGGQTTVSPAATVGLLQTLRYGQASAQYTRSVSVAGGLGGTTDTQTFSGVLTLAPFRRELFVVFSPVYNMAESVSRSGQNQRVDAKALTLNLSAYYQIARFVSVFGGYRFFQQRTGGSSTFQVNSDQNLVRFGVQVGYPFNFD
jgi:hypothetical protein